MRLLVINPFSRSVKREYIELTTGVINYYVQSSELQMMELGQEHLLFFDANWFRRVDQSFWTLAAAPNTLIGGCAVVAGKPENPADVFANCGLPDEAVENQILWIDNDTAVEHPALVNLRSDPSYSEMPKELIVRHVGNA